MARPKMHCYVTPGALAALEAAGADGNPERLLDHHFSGDWGEVDAEDCAANDRALLDGGRLLSSYTLAGTKFWVITDAVNEDGERTVTTILLPEEY